MRRRLDDHHAVGVAEAVDELERLALGGLERDGDSSVACMLAEVSRMTIWSLLGLAFAAK